MKKYSRPKNLLVKSLVIISSLILILAIVKIGEAAWQEPAELPVGGDYSYPITTSSQQQEKFGQLDVEGDNTLGSLESKGDLTVESADLTTDRDLKVEAGNLTVGTDALLVEYSTQRLAINRTDFLSATLLSVVGTGLFDSNQGTALSVQNHSNYYSNGTMQVPTYIYSYLPTVDEPTILGQSLSTAGGGGVIGKGGDVIGGADDFTAGIYVESGAGRGDDYAANFEGMVGINNFDFNYVEVTDISLPRYGHSATLLSDGNVLITGGWSLANRIGVSDSAEIYDYLTDIFSDEDIGPLNTARANHQATLLDNGKVLITGGYTVDGGGGITNTAEVFDPVYGTFTPVPGNMVEARVHHTASLLADGTVLLIGGEGPVGMLASTEIYDPEDGLFGSFADGPDVLITGRARHTTTTMPGTVLNPDILLIIGGIDNGGSALASAEIYKADSFTATTDDLDFARYDHSAVLLDNEGRDVFVFGGTNGVAYYGGEIYKTISDTFSAVVDTPQHLRTGQQAIKMGNGLVLVAGGYNADMLDLMEVYDIEADAFIDELQYVDEDDLVTKVSHPEFNSPSLASVRYDHTMTRLLNNKMLIVGGRDDINAASGGDPVPLSEKTEPALEVNWSGVITNLSAQYIDSHPAEDFVPAGFVFSSASLPLDQNSQSDIHLTGQGIFDGGLLVNIDGTNQDAAVTATSSSGIGLAVSGKSTKAGESSYGIYSSVTDNKNWAGYFAGRVQVDSQKTGFGSFINKDRLNYPTVGQQGSLLADGRIFMAGGNIGNGADIKYSSQAYLYNPQTEQLQSVSLLPTSRRGHQITSWGDKVIISGGHNTLDQDALTSGLIYDPATDQYQSSDLIFGRTNHTSTLLADGRLLIAGGFDQAQVGQAVTFTEIFDNGFGQGLIVPEELARGNHTATLLADDTVLLVGGTNRSDSSYLSSGLLIDPDNNQTMETTGIYQAIFHTANLLPDDNVLITGGKYQDQALNSALVYFPEEDKVNSLSGLNVSRYGHQAVSLADGKILLIGGQNDSGALDSCELFDPQYPNSGFTLIESCLLEPTSFAFSLALPDGSVWLSGGQGQTEKIAANYLGSPYQPPIQTNSSSLADLNAEYLNGFTASDLVLADQGINNYLQINTGQSANLKLAGNFWVNQSITINQPQASASVLLARGNGIYGLYSRAQDRGNSITVTNNEGQAAIFAAAAGQATTRSEIKGKLMLDGGLVLSGDKPAGQGIMAAEQNSVTVANGQMEETSLVLLTLTDTGDSQDFFDLEVLTKSDGSFTVSTSQEVSHQGISFDYLILN